MLLKNFEDQVVFWHNGSAIQVAQLLYAQIKTTEECVAKSVTEKKSKPKMFDIE